MVFFLKFSIKRLMQYRALSLPLQWGAPGRRRRVYPQPEQEETVLVVAPGMPPSPGTGRHWRGVRFWWRRSKRGRRSRSGRSLSWAPPATNGGSERTTASCTSCVWLPEWKRESRNHSFIEYLLFISKTHKNIPNQKSRLKDQNRWLTLTRINGS